MRTFWHVFDEHDDLDFERAGKAIDAYTKATSDNEDADDIMIY